jgi:hypothetical protein
MPASDYVSQVQNRQIRQQRDRPTEHRGTSRRSRKSVKAPRAAGMAGVHYPTIGHVQDFSWGYWGIPHMDTFGEQYDVEGDDAGGSFGI